jgi:membrane protein implicated in regulation of membrane protease activity
MLPLAIVIVVLLVAASAVAAASRHRKGAGAPLELIGRVATVERDIDPEGAVLVGGELMPARARGGKPITRATCRRVRVVGARGHCLEVEPVA